MTHGIDKTRWQKWLEGRDGEHGWLGGWECRCGAVAYTSWQRADHEAECAQIIVVTETQGALF